MRGRDFLPHSNPPLNRPRIRRLLSFIPTISTVFPSAMYFVSMASNTATVDASHTFDPDRSITTRSGSSDYENSVVKS